MILPQDILAQTEAHVRQVMTVEHAGHDWWHVYRVLQNARTICAEETGADLFVVTLAALLHDIADHKFHGGDHTLGPKAARTWLAQYDLPEPIIDHVADIIDSLSFKGAGVASEMATLEGKIVQDADRLDAIGAIGIARAFAYGGQKNRALYDPDETPVMHTRFEDYKNSKSSTINHFYEKLLLLKDLMNTPTAKRMAKARHAFMEEYLAQFYAEWDGQG